MSHTLRMLIGCLVPLSLIFLLPLFGVGSGVTLAIFLVLMFACHLLMMGGHGHGGHGGTADDGTRHDHASLTPEEPTHESPDRDALHQRHQH